MIYRQMKTTQDVKLYLLLCQIIVYYSSLMPIVCSYPAAREAFKHTMQSHYPSATRPLSFYGSDQPYHF